MTEEPPPRTPGRLRRALRVVLYSLLPLLLLLAVVEVALRLCGVGAPAEQLSVARGFDSQAPYLVQDEAVPGGWRTQMYDDPRDEVRIPPRDGRTRVLLFGGSNTRLFPERDLQAQLDAAAPGTRHEVVNLGCPGYGSERVLILLRQALDTLQPDVLVVYCGHNEFVEAGFAAELARAWAQPWFLGVASLAQRLHTVNLLVELARPAPEPVVSGTRPEPRGRREDLLDLRYEQTLLFYDVYRDNLRALCAVAQEHDTPLVLCTVVGNLLAPPVVSRHRGDVSRADDREFTQLRTRCLELLPQRLVQGIIGTGPGNPPLRLRWFDWGEHLLAADRFDRPVKAPRPPPVLRRLLPPLDGAPLWDDPAVWDSRVDGLMDTVSAFLARDLSPEERLAVTEATDLARRAVALSPDHAQAVFDLGMCVYLGGDTPQAVQLLRRAATLDCSPNRGNDLTNAIVRNVAAEHPEVELVDADRLFEQRTPDGLVTYEVVSDNCHLHPGARHALMSDFVPPIRRLAAGHGR